ncbi:MAG: hypothetical protein U1E22_02055, partial [Coriobacteriia bacterium]|nr:hypothetical protein [Coriobacteriia bacterium]
MANRNAIPPNARLPSQEDAPPDSSSSYHPGKAIPPLAPLPRIPIASVVQTLFERSPGTLPPDRPSSISPVDFPSAYPPPPLPPARTALLPFFAGGALGAILATTIAVGLLWSPSSNLQQASHWLSAAAPAAANPPHTIHYLPTVNIVASEPPEIATEPGPFDKNQARGLVASRAFAIHRCGLEGVDATISVTFEPSGQVSLVDVRGETPLPERATS